MTTSMSRTTLPIGAIVGGVGGVLAAVGAFIAWESVSIAGTGESMTGWDGGNGGKIIAVLGLVAIAVAVAWARGTRIPSPGRVMVVAGVLVLLVGVLNYSSVNDDVNAGNAMVPGAASVGIGIYLDLLAGVAIIVGGVLGLRARQN
ncbi:MAG: hypothetical protein ABSG37_02305 [Candidatus Limnocylindrales bacterium]